ncbi:hypothetical protein BDB01DRAFT_898088 [Pilobolus umbonatus]|nr:hypothetical protein BDB01DRAFT_898088 [Pilobolus umbonatus]
MSSSVPPFDYKNLHFIWFIGHTTTFLFSTLFLLSKVLFHPIEVFYRLSYLAVVFSYGIVLYNTHKSALHSDSLVRRLLVDENAQYMAVSIYFLFNKRLSNYIRSTLIPSLAPQHTKIQSSIEQLITQYYDMAMSLTAKIEVCGVLMRLVLGLLVFKSTIFSVLLYVHFIRMRYYMSVYTRQFLNELGTIIDKSLTPPTANPKVPAAVIQYYGKVKNILMKDSSKIDQKK